MLKATFWSDPDVLRWPAVKRLFYIGLMSLVEDSGCLEDDPFAWHCALFSPRDSDIDERCLTVWRDELVSSGKLVPYENDGKSYVYLRNFHRHQTLSNPRKPDIPLPPWVDCLEHETDWRKVRYEHRSPETVCTESRARVGQGLGDESGTVKGTEENEKEKNVNELESNTGSKAAIAFADSLEDARRHLESWRSVPLTSADVADLRGLCSVLAHDEVIAAIESAAKAGDVSMSRVRRCALAARDEPGDIRKGLVR